MQTRALCARTMVVAALCLVGAALVACSNPKDTVIPPDVSRWEDLRGSLDRLEARDRQLAVAYLDRTKSTAALTGQPIPTGVTIGQAIENQRQFEQAQAQQRLASRSQQDQQEERRKEAEERAGRVFAVTLTGKEIIGADFSAGRTADLVAFTFELRNAGDRDLIGAKGTLTVSDNFFGTELKVIPFDYMQPLPVGAVETYVARIPLSAQAIIDQRIRNTELSQMKVVFTPERLQFADGSRMDFSTAIAQP